MKILFLTRCYYPAVAYGGPVFVMRDLARLLVERGHQVTVWTTDILSLTDKLPGAPREERLDGVDVIYHRTGPGYRWDHYISGFGSFCRNRLHDFDVIHVFGYRDLMSPWACHYAAQRRIPYCLEPLGSLLPQLRSFRKKWLYDKTIGRVIVGGAARLIAASDQERNDIIGLGVPPPKVMCRPNAVHLSDFADLPTRGTLRRRLGIPDDGAVILFMSRINPIKGLERLIRAFEQMPASASLVVAGPEEDPAHLKQMRRLTAELGLESRVHFVGPVFGRDKLQALIDADIFALPSDRENFGVAAAEAVACGVPVVVTSTCGIGPIIKDRAGIVVEPAIGPLSKAIQGLVNHPETRDKLALGCRELRETLGWEEPLRIQEKIYGDLASW